jgi:hypothetical protein
MAIERYADWLMALEAVSEFIGNWVRLTELWALSG